MAYKYNEAVRKRIVEAIAMGSTRELAAKYGGVSPATFFNWMRDGERGEESEFRPLFEGVQQAEGERVKRWLDVIEKAAKTGNWTAAAWKLERLYPGEYGRGLSNDQVAALIAQSGGKEVPEGEG